MAIRKPLANNRHHGTNRHQQEELDRIKLLGIIRRNVSGEATVTRRFGVFDVVITPRLRGEAKGRDDKYWTGAPGSRRFNRDPWLPVNKHQSARMDATKGIMHVAFWHSHDLRDVVMLVDVANACEGLPVEAAKDAEREGNRDPVIVVPVGMLVVGWPAVLDKLKALKEILGG